MAVAASCNGGINILCLDDALLVVGMYNGFLGNNETCSDLNRLSSQHESSSHSSAVAYTACGDHRDGHCICHLGN